MITTILIGFLATSMYQLVFMVGYGTIITPHNREMMLSRGVGIRNMVDLDRFRNLLDSVWVFRFGEIEVPLFMLLVVCLMALVVNYILHTRLGRHFSAVGFSGDRVEALGLDPRLIRIKAIILSTVIACLGHIIFIQNIGMLNVYTAHLNTDIFSCAALLAGGATVTRAKVRHALIGIVLFHTLFVVSPQAGQNLFGNPALGEYFRSFVAYGTIAVALILNAKNSDKLPRGPANQGSKNLLVQEPATGSYYQHECRQLLVCCRGQPWILLETKNPQSFDGCGFVWIFSDFLHFNLAEKQGFEPWVESPPQRFSRPSRSAAPALLRSAHIDTSNADNLQDN